MQGGREKLKAKRGRKILFRETRRKQGIAKREQEGAGSEEANRDCANIWSKISEATKAAGKKAEREKIEKGGKNGRKEARRRIRRSRERRKNTGRRRRPREKRKRKQCGMQQDAGDL